MGHYARKPHTFNTALLVCDHCLRIVGCCEPTARTCGRCTTHNCPTLPAPRRSAGLCPRCTAPKIFGSDPVELFPAC